MVRTQMASFQLFFLFYFIFKTFSARFQVRERAGSASASAPRMITIKRLRQDFDFDPPPLFKFKKTSSLETWNQYRQQQKQLFFTLEPKIVLLRRTRLRTNIESPNVDS